MAFASHVLLVWAILVILVLIIHVLQITNQPMLLPNENENSNIRKNQRTEFSNTLVVFQYNWTPTLGVTTEFLAKWKSVFKNIILAIPKPIPKELFSLISEEIKVLDYQADNGFVSPLKNLVNVIKQAEDAKFDGILQLHDDMLVNITSILRVENWKAKVLTTSSTTGGYTQASNFTLKSGPLTDKWEHWRHDWGLESMKKSESKIRSYFGTISSEEILWNTQAQSDFTYLPKTAFDITKHFGKLLAESGVMIEIAYPKILQILETQGFDIVGLDLCTNWNRAKRKQVEEMARLCKLSKNVKTIDLFHPVKPGLKKMNDAWINWFGKLVSSDVFVDS